jgi:hypothetical protein
MEIKPNIICVRYHAGTLAQLAIRTKTKFINPVQMEFGRCYLQHSHHQRGSSKIWLAWVWTGASVMSEEGMHTQHLEYARKFSLATSLEGFI